MMFIWRSLLSIIILLNYLCSSQNTYPYEESIVVQFNKAALQALGNMGYGPTIVSRTSSILHTAIFNAWASFDNKAIAAEIKTFSRQPESERTFENRHKAISYAAYYTLKTLLPSQKSIFDKVMKGNGYDIQTLPNDRKTPAGLGISLAKELLSIKENDGSNQLGNLNPSHRPYSEPILLPEYKPYEYVNTVDTLNDINKWQPLRDSSGPQKYSAPHWGYITPFALKSGAELRPTEGPINTNDYPAFLAQAKRIYDVSKTLTKEQKLIARYWSGMVQRDPSAWDRIAQEISKRDQNGLDEDVQMFFTVSNALFDAIITAWNTQRHYRSVRPITVIRKLIDSKWMPLFYVPPQPDYISAHSTMIGAGAEALKLFTGSDYYGGSFTDAKTGIILTWPTFSDAAEQGRMSRVYAGVHFERATIMGKEVGKNVARAVWEKVQGYIDGKIENEIVDL